MRYLLWACFGLISYTYVIYPLVVMLIARVSSQSPQFEEDIYPTVSMLIPAYNEEAVLEEKIRNCQNIEYPEEKIEFIIGSDGSDDKTNDILKKSDYLKIKPFIFEERRGKSALINELVLKAKGEIILFSDANSLYQPTAVKKLVPYFADAMVGGVCGKLKLVNPAGKPGGEGEGLYWSFENLIKKAEGNIKSVISANGAIFAVKKDLLAPLPTKFPINDDFMITLQILEQGKRVVYEPKAVATERTSSDMRGEFVRKVRISSLNFNAVPMMLKMLHPSRGFVALSLFSHKLLRWVVPFLGLGLLVSNMFLIDSGGVYRGMLMFQGAIYIGAALGFLGDFFFDKSGPFIPFYYLAMVNLALVTGLLRSLTGTQAKAWKRVYH